MEVFCCVELQLKSYHLPCKLFKRWKDLLSQYTSCTFEEVCEGKETVHVTQGFVHVCMCFISTLCIYVYVCVFVCR